MDAMLFVCVDGGGTKTEALLADTCGHVLGRGLAGGSNALSVGVEQARQACLAAIRGALGETGWDVVCRLELFIPGFSSCLPLEAGLPCELHGDSPNAYFGALGQPDGIVLLAGTGSFAVSFDAQGRETTVGGWGPWLGDEGSGYDVGRRAVTHTLRRYDAGRPPTALGRAVLAHYGVEEASRLVHAVYHGGCDRRLMAALCPTVGDLARSGDRDALGVLRQAAESLAKLADVLQKRRRLRGAPVALTGGMSRLGDALLRPLAMALDRRGMRLQAPMYNPAVGGVLYTCGRLTGVMPNAQTAQRYYETYLNIARGQHTP